MSQTSLNWQKIYLDHSPKLLGICRRYITDLQNAEDVVQDSFITAMQKNHQLKDEKAMFAWLKKIVVNNALQFIRKTSKETFITTEPSEIPDTLTEMTTSATEDKKHILSYDFTREQLLQSIDSLPDHHKSVFNLYYLENFSHAEISNVLEIPVNTSKSHLLRAKKSVQNYLMTHFVNKETPRNKTAILLIFLGFGNSLWAKTFQNKFSDFAIVPEKSFKIPSDTSHLAISTTQKIWKNLAVGGTAAIVLTGAIFFTQNEMNSPETASKDISKINLRREKLQTKSNTDHSEQTADSHRKSDEKDVSIVLTTAKKDYPKIEIQSLSKNNIKSAETSTKDSAESSVEQVVVIKKVIQRDTVFIER